ncbi:MAG: hypothetical protein EOO00_12580 [Chitinophagaceae bacterium]|nr:MAG: hypothetical protein EOO00_12580 [Chitinophagaceae bacterium]
MSKLFDEGMLHRLQTDLDDLDREWIEVNGKKMKPSQCYRLETSPVHVLYNTNCPEALQKRINQLLKKYFPG